MISIIDQFNLEDLEKPCNIKVFPASFEDMKRVIGNEPITCRVNDESKLSFVRKDQIVQVKSLQFKRGDLAFYLNGSGIYMLAF
jgi:hypothetical protein